MTHQRRRLALTGTFAAVAVLVALSLAGCGDDDGPMAPGPNAPEDTFAVASTADAAAQRLFDTYEARDTLAYDRTLTRDFRYFFSSQSDPGLVAQYGDTWGVDLEMTSAGHLFAGFLDEHGALQPSATSIVITTPPVTALADPSHTDSTRHYACVPYPTVLMDISLANDANFSVSAPFTVFVVRGDAAVLGSDQSPDSTAWYVYRIEDLSPALPGSPGVRGPVFNPAEVATWGSVRALYAARRAVVIE